MGQIKKPLWIQIGDKQLKTLKQTNSDLFTGIVSVKSIPVNKFANK